MQLALTIDLGDRRLCRRRGHRINKAVKRCPVCDEVSSRAWYEQRKEQVREYNKSYNAQMHIKEYRRRKTAEYRQQQSVRDAHNTAERQRAKDERYSFVRLVRSYGMEVIDFAYRLRAQDFKCAACRDVLGMGRETHIDHCHTTGEVRGILCSRCNLSLGHAKDTPQRLRALADYLERYWYKGAEPVYVDGKLVPWEPREAK